MMGQWIDLNGLKSWKLKIRKRKRRRTNKDATQYSKKSAKIDENGT